MQHTINVGCLANVNSMLLMSSVALVTPVAIFNTGGG
jgi:hypothetical protein